MRTLIVIPARLAATRLPSKPLRSLAGKPLIVRVWERVNAMRLCERCVVATDDSRVADAARTAGAESVMTSGEWQSGTERVAEVARDAQFHGYDVIVNVQGDEPFIARASVAGAIAAVTESGFGVGTAAVHAGSDILRNPDVVKVVAADDGRALYFSRAGIPYPRDGAAGGSDVLQHVGVYAYTRSALARWVSLPPHRLELVERLEQLRPLAAGIPIGVTTTEDPPVAGIDTEDDLAHANERWTELTA